MDISSLLNPSLKAASRARSNPEPFHESSNRPRFRRPPSNHHGRVTDDTIHGSLHQTDQIHQHQRNEVNHSVAWPPRVFKPGHRPGDTLHTTSPRPSSSGDSAEPDLHLHQQLFSPLPSYSNIQSRAHYDQDGLRSFDSTPVEQAFSSLASASRRTSASSTSASIAAFGSPHRRSHRGSSTWSVTSSQFAVGSPSYQGYPPSSDTLAAFASVAIADGEPLGYDDIYSFPRAGREASRLQAMDAPNLESARGITPRGQTLDQSQRSIRSQKMLPNGNHFSDGNDGDVDSLYPDSPEAVRAHLQSSPYRARRQARYAEEPARQSVARSESPMDNSRDSNIPKFPAEALSGSSHSQSGSSGTPQIFTIGDDAGPRCSYTDNCTTGSPLRKVVSHIFGRNKLCTRQIPKGVWVHYCRKHYQRSRYRNPHGFALLQCDLVRKQVDRLEIWGGVTDWIVKVRKREELRLNRENAELAAGRDDDGGEDEEVGSEHPGLERRGTAAGASRWLVRSVGAGKSTAEVLAILSHIEDEIASSGSNFPDVEILPNVTSERTAVTSSASIRSQTPTHRSSARSQSGNHGDSGRGAEGDEEYSIGSNTGTAYDARKRKASSGSSQARSENAEHEAYQSRPTMRHSNTSGGSRGLAKRQRMKDISQEEEIDEDDEPVRSSSRQFRLSRLRGEDDGERPTSRRDPTTDDFHNSTRLGRPQNIDRPHAQLNDTRIENGHRQSRGVRTEYTEEYASGSSRSGWSTHRTSRHD